MYATDILDVRLLRILALLRLRRDFVSLMDAISAISIFGYCKLNSGAFGTGRRFPVQDQILGEKS
jgi:hypothetical protein